MRLSIWPPVFEGKVLNANGALILHSSVLLLLILPLLGWSVFQSWEHAIALQERQLRTLTRTLAQREQLLIEGGRSFLRALALSESFHNADKPLKPEQARQFLKQFYQIQKNYFGLFAFLPDGQKICAFVDGKEYEAPPELIKQRRYFHAMQGKNLHVGPPVILVNGRCILPMSMASLDEKGIPRALLMLPLDMSDELQSIRRTLESAAFPMQQIVALRDCTGTVWDLTAGGTPQATFSEVRPLLESAPEPLSLSINSQNAERFTTWRDHNGKKYTGFMISISLDSESSEPGDSQIELQVMGVMEPMPLGTFLLIYYRWQMAGMSAILLIACFLARHIGLYYFSEGLKCLTDAVSSARSGLLHARVGKLHGCRELLELSAGYDTMMSALQASTGELRILSTTDSLTGLLNRRELMRLARREITRAQRTGQPLLFVMLDLDYFKRVNDVHGHIAGDAVLSAFATVLRQTLRKSDLIGRYGGEEFLLCLPETGVDAVGIFLEKIRETWEKTEVPGPNGVIRCTVSGGAYVLPRVEKNTKENQMDKLLETSISRADNALYRAKDVGRNTILLWNDFE